MPYFTHVCSQCRNDIPLHALHVVDIVLQLDILLPDGLNEPNSLLCLKEEIGTILKRVDCLNQYLAALFLCLIGCPSHVFTGEFELFVTSQVRKLAAYQCIEFPGT